MSTTLRCLIVDDEPAARDFLLLRLKPHPELRVVAEAGSVSAALAHCKALRPDVIFLDINLHGADGFSLAGKLESNHQPAIVFVTADDRRGFEAYQLHAVDYLLKPYSAQRMAITAKKLLQHFAALSALTPAAPQPDSSSTPIVFVEEGKNMIEVKLSEIALIEAEASYTKLKLITGGYHLIRKSITSWLETLPTHDFCQVDRFHIVNLQHVVKFEQVSRNLSLVHLRGLSRPKELRRQGRLRLNRRLADRAK